MSLENATISGNYDSLAQIDPSLNQKDNGALRQIQTVLKCGARLVSSQIFGDQPLVPATETRADATQSKAIPTIRFAQMIPAITKNIEKPGEMFEELLKLHGNQKRLIVPMGAQGHILIESDSKAAKQLLNVTGSKTEKFPGGFGVFFPFLGEKATFVLATGDEHAERLAALRKIFFDKEHLAHYATPIVASVIEESIAYLKQYDGETVDFAAMSSRMTLKVIIRYMFGVDLPFNDEVDEVTPLLEAFTSYFEFIKLSVAFQASLDPFRFPRFVFPKQHNAREIIAKVQDRILEANSPEPLTPIMEVFLSKKKDGTPLLPFDDLRGEIISMLMAGYDTTATALTWIPYYLHNQKDSVEKLLKATEDLELSDAEACADPTLAAFSNTIFQLASPFPVLPRLATKDIEYTDSNGTKVFLPKGMGVVLMTGLASDLNGTAVSTQDPLKRTKSACPFARLFGKGQKKLKPEDDPGRSLVFGTGKRFCLGYPLAKLEIELFALAFLREFEFTLPEGFEPEIVGIPTSRPKTMPVKIRTRTT